MAKLDTAERKELPGKDFAGPHDSYPVEDKAHARDAKARASEEERKGKLSKPEEAHIDAKANHELGEKGDMPREPKPRDMRSETRKSMDENKHHVLNRTGDV